MATRFLTLDEALNPALPACDTCGGNAIHCCYCGQTADQHTRNAKGEVVCGEHVCSETDGDRPCPNGEFYPPDKSFSYGVVLCRSCEDDEDTAHERLAQAEDSYWDQKLHELRDEGR